MKPYAKNTRYIEYKGKPIVVIGSGEHYGAVLNADFDFIPYLDAMAKQGLNQCRAFSGTYRELPGEFDIAENTLAPRQEAFLCPWRKTGDKWDLTAWDDAYWNRLIKFVDAARQRNVLVEYVLFCFWYNDHLWEASPMNPANNVQGVGPTKKEDVYNTSGPLLNYQLAFVKKAAETLRSYENVYFEICNEPYINNHTMFEDWHQIVAERVVEAAPGRPIAVNYQNRTTKIKRQYPGAVIANFHYAIPEAVHDNWHLGLVLADDETGFAGQSTTPYRREAWLFFLSGGGMFSHLDYSFTVAHPDGSAPITGKTPGYGGEELRRQFGYLRRFLEAIKVWDMKPANDILPPNTSDKIQVLGESGRKYAVYFAEDTAGSKHTLTLSRGKWKARWIDPITCKDISTETLTVNADSLTVTTPIHGGEVALLLSVIK